MPEVKPRQKKEGVRVSPADKLVSELSGNYYKPTEVAEILGLPDDIEQVAFMPVAYFTGATFRPANRLPTETFVHWDSWDADRQMQHVPSDVAAERVMRAREEMGRLFAPPE